MVGFHITVEVTNPDMLEKLKARMLDLTPLFDAIIKEWTEINKQKFDLSKGGEGGVSVFGESWKALTPEYQKQKRKEGYPDWLMVRTGNLMRSMTDPDMIFKLINPMDAVFGTPLDPKDAEKVSYNWLRRQVVFLGIPDENMIKAYAQAYLDFGAPFESVLAARTTYTQKKAIDAEFNMDFANALAHDTGDWGEG